MGGRRPKAAAIKEAEGNRGKKARASLIRNPQGRGEPTPSDSLSIVELALWDDVIASMPRGTFTAADAGCIERYVVAWRVHREAKAAIEMTGMFAKGDRGTQRSAATQLLFQAAKEMQSAGSELGLSPASRNRLAEPAMTVEEGVEFLLGREDDQDEWMHNGAKN